MLIINADDWGRSRNETDLAMECYSKGRITSVTTMVFMEDSERAADLAGDAGMTVGLHLNLSEPFTGKTLPTRLVEYHQRVCRFLKMGRYAVLIYNPLLQKQFRYVYEAQADEFGRLYGKNPSHIDGHQHLHLCANVLLGNVIPCGEKMRRNFSFWPGERSFVNRAWRCLSDRLLERRYRSTQYFFCLSKVLESGRLDRVLELARRAFVELMVHPVRRHEYGWLMSAECAQGIGAIQTGAYTML